MNHGVDISSVIAMHLLVNLNSNSTLHDLCQKWCVIFKPETEPQLCHAMAI